MDLLYNCGVNSFAELPNKDKIDGKELFSVLLPQDFNFLGKDKSGNEVKIVNGKLITGFMDKSNLGQESGLMFRNIYEKYGASYTSELLGKISKLGIGVLSRRGFSIGIADLDLTFEAQEQVKDIIKKAEEEAFALIDKYHAGKLEHLPGRTIMETLELRVLEALEKD